jgi:hypothetical protein
MKWSLPPNWKVISFLSGYWLDVGKHEDFDKAQIRCRHAAMK